MVLTPEANIGATWLQDVFYYGAIEFVETSQYKKECVFVFPFASRLFLIQIPAGKVDVQKFFHTCIPFATNVMVSAVEK